MAEQSRPSCILGPLLLLVALAAGGSFAMPLRAAEAARTGYDPASCPTDAEGMVYLAYGRDVLQFPSYMVRRFEAKPEQERARFPASPEPPDPSAPPGCPGNPLQLYAYTVWYAGSFIAGFGGLPMVEWPYPARALKQLELIPTRPDFWGRSQENLSRTLCEMASERGIVQELDSKLTECIVQPNVDVPRKSWARAYRADPKTYSAPFNQLFVVICVAGGTRLPQACTVSYKLFPHLNIYYWIDRDLFESPDFKDFISVDRAIRGPLEAALVAGYAWPDEPPSPPTPNSPSPALSPTPPPQAGEGLK